MRSILFLLPLTLLAACASPKPEPLAQLVIPDPTQIIDPSDAALKRSVKTFLSTTHSPAASQYRFVRHDLDHDGRRDALVLFETPYGHWCGIHGCTMMVFKAHNTGFNIINAIQPIREPLYISEHKQNGWKDLVVRVSGRYDKAKNVAMQFNGNTYPFSPAHLPSYETLALNSYTRVFDD